MDPDVTFANEPYMGCYRNQKIINGTIQMDVLPGDQTGLYHITVANLPFGTSWQRLKDFVRQVCIVEHVEVFRNSTSGWVRVRGKDNFLRAWTLLNGGNFDGKAVIADNSNATRIIKIKKLMIDTSQPLDQYILACMVRYPEKYGQTSPPQSPTFSSRGTVESESPALSFITMASPVFSAVQPVPTYGYQSPQLSVQSAYDYDQQDMTGYYAQHNLNYAPQAAALASGYAQTPASQYTYPAQYHGVEFLSPPPAQPSGSKKGTGTSQSGGLVQTEARKIFIRQISRKASKKEVEDMIYAAAGSDRSNIQSLDVAIDENNLCRGHATVTFADLGIAQRVCDKLHQAPFHDRLLEARPAVDYPTKSKSSHHSGGKHHNGGSPNGESGKNKDHKKKEDKKDENETAPSSSSGQGSMKKPVIAVGSSGSSRKDRDENKKRH